MKIRKEDMNYNYKRQENKSSKILIKFQKRNKIKAMIKMKFKIRKNKKRF
jgi:hypothetical protein